MNAEARLTARMLRALSFLPWLSAVLTILAAGALAIGDGNDVAATLSVASGVVASYYGFRIALDRWLFEDIVEGRMTTSELDALTGRPGRPWPERCRGARRLMFRGSILTSLQLATLAFAGILPT
jgi:hypothetical protein